MKPRLHRNLQRIGLLFFVLVSSALFSASQVTALEKSSSVIESQTQFEQETTEDKTNITKTADLVFYSTAHSLLGMMAGCISDACTNELADSGGAVQGMGRMIAGVYASQPASVDTYIADVMQNMGIGIVQPAYAQGIGFSSLQPILSLWKIFRDIAYVFFVFVFLVIGFAIMFRRNLGGQTAVTIQQALPRIIVALLAVSFSYAIAGLLIDLMYLFMFFLTTIFSQANLIPNDVSGNLVKISFNPADPDGNFILNKDIITLYLGIITGNFAGKSAGIIGGLVDNAFSATIGQVGGEIFGGIAHLLTALIIFFALIFAMFRTFFSLIKIYFEIILTIIFAPVILMLGAINSNAFGNWLKGLAVNLMVFPALLIFIIVGFVLVNFDGGNASATTQQLSEGGFVPPFIPGRGTAQNIGLIAGIAAIMLLPEVASTVQKFKPSSVWDELTGKAISNAQAGAPAGAALGGALVGGAVGLPAGVMAGLSSTRGMWRRDPLGAAYQLFSRTGRGAGNFAARGSRFAHAGANMAGGKTPAGFGWVEGGAKAAGQYFSDEARLKRIESGKGDLSKVFTPEEGVQDVSSWDYKLKVAKGKATQSAIQRERARRGLPPYYEPPKDH